MADWQRQLNLMDVWKQADITPQQLASVIADRLKALKPLGNNCIDGCRDELVENFQMFAKDEDVDFDDFDQFVMRPLYDWADVSLDNKFGGKKVCWIKTF